MQKLIFRNGNGKEINLTSGDYGITEWEGFSANELNIQSQQVPFQDGGVFLDALLEQRILSVTVAMNAKNDLEKRYRLRREMISTLNPKLGEGLLIYTNDFLSKQIHVIPQLPVFENNNSNDSGTPKVSCSFVACNPYWEDIEETEVYFNIGDTKVIENEGDVPCQMKIDLYTNYAKNPQIVNLSSNELIRYNGILSTTLKINTNAGQKGVYAEKIVFKTNNAGNGINSVTYSEDLKLFVAVGSNGLILTSTNGLDWESVEYTAEKQDLYSVVYSEENNLFVAVGGHGFVVTSPNGKAWTQRINDHPYTFYNVIFAEGRFIAVGERGYEGISSDGVNWDFVGISPTYLSQITFSKRHNLYVGVSGYSEIYTSADGVHWILSATMMSSSVKSVTYCDELNKFIAVGSGIFTSLNGTIWNTVEDSQYSLNSVYYCANMSLFIAVGSQGSSILVKTSSDGVNWTSWYGNDIGLEEKDFSLKNIAFSKYSSLLIIVGERGFIINSKNGVDWEKSTAGIAWELKKVVYSEKLGTYVFLTNEHSTGAILKSQNLIDFETVYIQSEPDYCELNDIIYSEELDKFVVVGDNGVIVTSSDGENWENIQIENIEYNLYVVEYSKLQNKFISVDSSGRVFTSSDIINWTQTTQLENTYPRFLGEFEDKGFIVLLGDYGISVYENNGWNEYKITANLRSIAYSKELNLFVAVGESISDSYPIVYSSKDCENWELVWQDSMNGGLTSVIYSEEYSMFMAGGAGGIAAFSSDGLNWSKSHLGVSEDLFDICNRKKDIIFVGYAGCVESLSFEEAKNEIQNLSQDSNIGMKLEVGQNNFSLSKDSGNFSARITYRQKYLGV